MAAPFLAGDLDDSVADSAEEDTQEHWPRVRYRAVSAVRLQDLVSVVASAAASIAVDSTAAEVDSEAAVAAASAIVEGVADSAAAVAVSAISPTVLVAALRRRALLLDLAVEEEVGSARLAASAMAAAPADMMLDLPTVEEATVDADMTTGERAEATRSQSDRGTVGIAVIEANLSGSVIGIVTERRKGPATESETVGILVTTIRAREITAATATMIGRASDDTESHIRLAQRLLCIGLLCLDSRSSSTPLFLCLNE